MRSFLKRFSSNNTPRNLIDGILSILSLFISSLGNFSGMSSFSLALWQNEYFAFVMLRESLLARHYWWILLNSLFTVANGTMILQIEKNANIIGLRIFEEFSKLLTYSRNRSGLKY